MEESGKLADANRRKNTLAALGASMAFAVICIIAGAVLSTSTHTVAGSGTVHSLIPILSPSSSTINISMISLVFSIIATIFTEIIGFAHSTSLRSILIDEGRLRFNTNARLFTASKKGGWANPNGRLMNALMALLLVMSYASSELVVMRLQHLEGPDYSITKYRPGLSAPPIIVFGISLFLQGVISLFGAYHCGPYWLESTNVLATTKWQIERNIIVRRQHRCMRNVLQGQSTTPDPRTTAGPPTALDPLIPPDPLTTPDPLEPSARQPSAWSASPAVKTAVIVVWGLIPVYTIWGAIIYALSIYAFEWKSKSGNIQTIGIGSTKLSEISWAFLPNENELSFGVAYLTTHAKEAASLPSWAWPSILLAFMAIQSGLTLALHYCEAIINTTRDEHIWRQAADDRGVAISQQWPLRAALSSWRNVFLLVGKSFCHWIFGHSLTAVGEFAQSFDNSGALTGSNFLGIEVLATCAQVWYLSAVLVGFATVTTVMAKYKPRGPQPAAYGHFQTLADLIDEWPPERPIPGYKLDPVLYWGHKRDKDGVCHAGTSSDKSLVHPVDMEGMYGGELDEEPSSTAKTQCV
ncbi:hypothetical protein FIBSPDRAFT_1043204 [Athelia psychrophila]|uniref:Uncharacterized protein n=1 Tax=Athelia psychrophila TaxID=1759441 RepID=A0A166LL54_9AGAM|nr:hypothetical protein FIBSPDRAFT_1043204 [Fibularhizoctonia sp. CBS 109695]